MNKLTKNLKCISIRNGIEIWIDSEKVKILQKKLETIKSSIFINYDGRTINTADITGIYKAIDIEEMKRRKNGQWQCKYNNWHDRNEKCNCNEIKKQKLQQQRIELSKKCGKCDEGYILMLNKIGIEEWLPCECIYPTIDKEELNELEKYIKENDFREKPKDLKIQ